jgi:hypothetical protein
MTRQEMFTKVWLGLEAQGWKRSLRTSPASEAEGSCAYRGMNGAKCAAGHLIPDENYKPEMEGLRIMHLVRHNPLIFGEPLDTFEEHLAYKMQRAHDFFKVEVEDGSMKNFEDMKSAFEEIARIYKFTIPEREQAQ